MKHSVKTIAIFEELLNEKKCAELAREHKFIQRSSSKLQGSEFIKAMITPSEGLSTDSLKGICMRIREFNSEADLSAQALCERINDASAKNLMKGTYATILSYLHSKATDNFSELQILTKFNRILIEDSSVIKLNEKLQEDFQGTNRGGNGAKSQIKIDVIYDLMKGSIVNAELYNGNDPDQGLAGRIISFINAGDLVVRDLGYFVLKVFQDIIEMNSYFISRIPPHVKIFLRRDDKQAIDLGSHLAKKYSQCSIIDMPLVFLGDEKIPVRLVFYRLPKHIVEAKLKEANKRAKATGRTMSSSKKMMLQFAVFATNVPAESIPAEVIGTIYRLRWEIELIFKRWKGQLKIDFLKGINKNRIECLIWSRLCTILIIEIINGHITRIAYKMDREISHAKVINYILRQSKFHKSVVLNQQEKFANELEKDIPRMLLKDKRKRRTMRERVSIYESYYNAQPAVTQKVA